ncbi:MAG: hypothetical protein PUC00_04275 [Clostridiales bacterium]|nr:hypothetical protein [Clostridiales bacterium]
MSETANTNGAFTVPPDQDFNTMSFQGSIQQVLQENVGKYVIVEFLIGTYTLTSRQGLLYYVGTQFLVLYDEFESRFVVCDIFSVKFVTFLDTRSGRSIPPLDLTAVPGDASTDVPAVEAGTLTPSQAAYAHATRRTPATRL